jgi:hypothetical protein
LNDFHSVNKAMGQKQGQQFGLINKVSTEAGLHLGGSEHELLTAL